MKELSVKELICIACPTGCRLSVEEEEGRFLVTGNRCKRGEAFAQAECTHPTRTLTTTVRTAFAGAPMLPVRTAAEIPKEKLFAAMAAVRGITVSRPLKCGETVAENLAGTGVALICTSGLLEEIQKSEADNN